MPAGIYERLPNVHFQPEAARFWEKVSGGGYVEFHEWRGFVSPMGYGAFNVRRNGRRTIAVAHRYAYESVNGKLPDGMVVDHLCENKVCVNPLHLEAVTRGENSRRANIKSDEPCMKCGGNDMRRTPKGQRYCGSCATAKQRWVRAKGK